MVVVVSAATRRNAGAVKIVRVAMVAAGLAAALVDRVVTRRTEVADGAGAIVWACDGATAPTGAIAENKRLTHE